MAPGKVLDFEAFMTRTDVTPAEKIRRLGDAVVEHTAVEQQAARERAAIAARVGQLDVLARTGAEAQRATGDAMSAVATAVETIVATQAEHGGRLESIEEGLFVVVGAVGRIERRLDGREASDVDLLARVEREQAAREAEDARQLAMIAPLIADTARKAGNAGATKTAGAMSVAALAAGLVAQPVETVRLVREIGPTGLVIAVVLFVVVAAGARFRRP